MARYLSPSLRSAARIGRIVRDYRETARVAQVVTERALWMLEQATQGKVSQEAADRVSAKAGRMMGAALAHPAHDMVREEMGRRRTRGV